MGCRVAAGYDRVTGLGAPNVQRLIAALTQAPTLTAAGTPGAKKPATVTG